MKVHRVVVVGGGYAGVLAALRVARQLGAAGLVSLVSSEPDLIERTRLHEAAVTGRAPRVPISTLVGREIDLVVGAAERVEPGRVELDGRTLTADAVIVATGRTMRSPFPQAAVLDGDGTALHAALAARQGRVLVVGGGLTGIELAGELAERGRAVTLISPSAHLGGIDLTAEGSEACARALRAVGVDLARGRVIEAGSRGVSLEDGTSLDGLPVVTAGMALGRPFGLGPVDAFLESAPGLFVAGDAAADDVGVRTGCKTAMPLGAHAADNVVRRLRGEPLVPFSWRFFGSCVSIGRRRGVVEGAGILATDRVGAWLKERVLRYTLQSMWLERTGLLTYRWPKAASRPLLPSVAG